MIYNFYYTFSLFQEYQGYSLCSAQKLQLQVTFIIEE